MLFDVPKVVRSSGRDHRHDKEFRNGRDIKIDILDDYIRTSEVFRVISEKTGVSEGYRNPSPPGELMGHMGLSGERRNSPSKLYWIVSSWDVTELNVCRSRRCRTFGTRIGRIEDERLHKPRCHNASAFGL